VVQRKKLALTFVFLLPVFYFLLTRSFILDRVLDFLGPGIVLRCYAKPFLTWALAFICLFILPLMIVMTKCEVRSTKYEVRKNKKIALEEAGLAWPKWSWPAGVLTVLGVGVMILSAWTVSKRPDFQMEYPLCPLALNSWQGAVPYFFGYLVYYAAWEFYFRGFVQLYLAKEIGASWAMFWQVILSTVIHWGKPGLEFWGAVPGGIFFGYLALATKSVLPSLFLHVQLGFLTDALCRINAVNFLYRP